MLGAGRVIAIDKIPERLEMAKKFGRAETLDYSQVKIYDAFMEMTKGRGPDSCIDCVGLESDALASFDAMLDKQKPQFIWQRTALMFYPKRFIVAGKAAPFLLLVFMQAFSIISRLAQP